jgi:hypothetical protein
VGRPWYVIVKVFVMSFLIFLFGKVDESRNMRARQDVSSIPPPRSSDPPPSSPQHASSSIHPPPPPPLQQSAPPAQHSFASLTPLHPQQSAPPAQRSSASLLPHPKLFKSSLSSLHSPASRPHSSPYTLRSVTGSLPATRVPGSSPKGRLEVQEQEDEQDELSEDEHDELDPEGDVTIADVPPESSSSSPPPAVSNYCLYIHLFSEFFPKASWSWSPSWSPSWSSSWPPSWSW